MVEKQAEQTETGDTAKANNAADIQKQAAVVPKPQVKERKARKANEKLDPSDKTPDKERRNK